jgi:hypothetical protein
MDKLIKALRITDVVVTAFGAIARKIGNKSPNTFKNPRNIVLVSCTPSMGWIMPGRNITAALNGNAISAFSVSPFTRAHMVFDPALVPAPLT